MMNKKHSIKQRLINGENLAGCWVTLYNSLIADVMASAGYDFAMIDFEHGPGSYLDAIPIMQVLEGKGCAPIIRTCSANIVDIKRTLDIGPRGIMVPNVRNAAEAREVVAHCRYAPDGDRGAAPAYIRATGFGIASMPLDDYQKFMRDDFLLIAQIESKEAVDDLENIVAVDGIDMIFIGPADLSASLGKLADFTSPAFRKAVARIETIARTSGKFLGAVPFGDWTPEQQYKKGYQLIVGTSDIALLVAAAKKDCEQLIHAASLSQTGSS